MSKTIRSRHDAAAARHSGADDLIILRAHPEGVRASVTSIGTDAEVIFSPDRHTFRSETMLVASMDAAVRREAHTHLFGRFAQGLYRCAHPPYQQVRCTAKDQLETSEWSKLDDCLRNLSKHIGLLLLDPSTLTVSHTLTSATCIAPPTQCGIGNSVVQSRDWHCEFGVAGRVEEDGVPCPYARSLTGTAGADC
jgi:hypothetical protein